MYVHIKGKYILPVHVCQQHMSRAVIVGLFKIFNLHPVTVFSEKFRSFFNVYLGLLVTRLLGVSVTGACSRDSVRAILILLMYS